MLRPGVSFLRWLLYSASDGPIHATGGGGISQNKSIFQKDRAAAASPSVCCVGGTKPIEPKREAEAQRVA